MKKIVCILIGLLWFVFSGLGQAKQLFTPIGVGDFVPDISMGKLINYSPSTIQFHDFKGKLLILDFWATWCGSCIQNFPKMENLQKQFGDQIQIMGVTNESEDKVQKFLSIKTDPNGHKYRIASVIEDKVLSNLFPHRFIPHCVWIGVDGKVKAITGADEVTAPNIEKMLNGNNVVSKVKKDLDTSRPLFLSADYPDDNELLQYSILSKGTYRGYPEGGKFRTTNGIVHGRAITNSSLLSIYEQAIFQIFQSMNDYYDNKRLLLLVKDSSEIMRTKKMSNEEILENNYNYDIIVPTQKSDSLYWYMLRDLNHYTYYSGKIEKRLTKCLVLTRTSSIDKIKTQGGNLENTIPAKPSKLINGPLSYLVMRLNADKSITLPIIDETNYQGNIDIRISGNLNLQVLRKELQHYDLDLAETERYLNTFILQDNAHSANN